MKFFKGVPKLFLLNCREQVSYIVYYAIVKYTNLSQSCSTQVSERSGYQISFRAIEKLPNKKRFNFQGNFYENRQLIGPS